MKDYNQTILHINKTDLDPKIYVVCPSSYYAGFLDGSWIDANQDAESIYKAILNFLSERDPKNLEDWEIRDCKGFGGISIIKCCDDIQLISDMAAFVIEHGKLGAEVYNWVDDGNECKYEYLREAKRLIEKDYYGSYYNEAEFVSSYIDEICTLPFNVDIYINYERMASDWFINSFFSIKIENKVHVFSR